MENPNETGPLNFDDARQEADMMLAHLEEMGIENPTREDYEIAQQVIDEIKTAAENEPDAEKLAVIIGRIVQNVGRGLAVPVIIVDHFLYGVAELTGNSNENPKATMRKGPWVTEMLGKLDAATTELLSDAAKKLREMERKGRQVDSN